MTQDMEPERPLDLLFGDYYQELRRLAHRQRMPGDGATLDTTALVHELYLQMSRNQLDFEQTRQFYSYAARAMRHLLVDRARERMRMKHGGDMRRTEYSDTRVGNVHVDPAQALELDDALRRLELDDKRAADIVELHYFAGQDLSQTADLLGISRRTADRDWQSARAYLQMQLE